VEAVLRIINNVESHSSGFSRLFSGAFNAKCSCPSLICVQNRDYVTRNGYVHLAPKMRDNDTRHIREYVPLVVTETQSDRGVIEEQPALLKYQ